MCTYPGTHVDWALKQNALDQVRTRLVRALQQDARQGGKGRRVRVRAHRLQLPRWSVAVVNLFVKRKRDLSSLYLCCTISLTFECLRLCLQKTQRRPAIYEQMCGYSKFDCTASTAENRLRDAGSGPLFAPHVVRRGNAHEAAERLGQQAPAASTAEPHLRSLQMQQRQGCNWRRVSPPWR